MTTSAVTIIELTNYNFHKIQQKKRKKFKSHDCSKAIHEMYENNKTNTKHIVFSLEMPIYLDSYTIV